MHSYVYRPGSALDDQGPPCSIVNVGLFLTMLFLVP